MAATLLVLAATPCAASTPTYAATRAAYRTSETLFTDRHGEVVQVLRTDPTVRRLAWTALADVSPALRAALILSEDKHFYEHSGVDWTAVGAAAWGNLWNTRTRGASTITMQLAGLLDDDLRAGDGGRSVGQKLSQAATAVALERGWKKDQILEAYLNLVGYRGELVGVGALSATLFEKYPSGLDTREAAITAALVRAPNAPPSRVAERACAILVAEGQSGECRGLDDYTALVLARKGAPRLDSDPQLAPQFARAVLRRLPRGQKDPGVAAMPALVPTTLDARLQRFARATLRTHLAELAERNVEDGAVVVLDNRTGEVLAWVGSSGSLSDAAEVDHVLAPRQAGSTLKPFLYELAIEKRWLTAASILDDSPVNLATTGGLYIPQNYDHDFKGPVSVRTALGSSLNVPAVRTLVMVTPERFHQRLRALGISTLHESGDYYGYALALGSAEVTLADLANAYRALGNRGTAGPIVLFLPTRDGAPALATRPGAPMPMPTPTPALATRSAMHPATRAVMDPAAASIVVDILADREARVTTFGMHSVLGTRTWSAVKTGTSKDMRDNWCVGFTGRYTVGVWVGNSSGAPMWDVSGTTGAAPVWQAIVDYVARSDRGSANAGTAIRPASPSAPAFAPAPAPARESDVVRRDIRFDGDLEAARSELFLRGTEVDRIARSAALPGAAKGGGERHGNGSIAQPVDGTIVAIDPDIPPLRQRLTFKTALRRAGTVRWRLDGRVVGQGPSIDWPIWPGRHTLELVAADAAPNSTTAPPLDTIRFEVRGADLRVARGGRPARDLAR